MVTSMQVHGIVQIVSKTVCDPHLAFKASQQAETHAYELITLNGASYEVLLSDLGQLEPTLVAD